MSRPVEILCEALNLLRRRGWTQGAPARTASGAETPADSPQAACYCSLGAVWVAAQGHERSAWHAAEQILANAIADDDPRGTKAVFVVGGWNDTKGRTREEVIAMFERAIAKATPPQEPTR